MVALSEENSFYRLILYCNEFNLHRIVKYIVYVFIRLRLVNKWPFAMLSLVYQKDRTMKHPVRIELTNNGLLA